MAVVTLFFCGTAANRTKSASNPTEFFNGELISRLGLRCSGTEEVTKFTIDGPGSGNLQEKWKIRGRKNYSGLQGLMKGKGWDENVMYAIDTLLGRVNRKLISPSDLSSPSARATKPTWMPDRDASTCSGCHSRFSGVFRTGKHHCRLCGKVFCENCTKNRLSIKDPLSPSGFLPGDHDEQRVCQTCFTVKFREYHEKEDEWRAERITRINCIGWSRGGVTTHMFANACDDEPLLKGKEIRLIAVDPVPGGSEMSTHRVQIYNPALKEYVVFFARDERSRMFSPTLVQINQPPCDTKKYFFPGNHSTLVGNSRRDSILYNSAVLVRHIAETHLKAWGTEFERTLQLSDHEVLRYYDQMLAHRRHFEKLQAKSILGGGTRFGPTQGGGRTMMAPKPLGVELGKAPSAFASNAVWIKLHELDTYAKNVFFVNWHHKDVARKLLPRVVEFIEQTSSGGSGRVSRQLLKDMCQEINRVEKQFLCHNLAISLRIRCHLIKQLWDQKNVVRS